jgi:hypothetical protein
MLMSIVVAGAAAYIALCAWIYATQRAQVYFPTPATDHPPARALWIDNEGERLKVWTVLRPGPGALIYFGGNAEDVGGSVEPFAEAFPERSLYLVNYRGYGGSTGRPSEAALFSDALAVYGYVRARHADITVMGRSLGGGVAAYVASERPVDRLVLVTAFDSLVNVAREYFWWLPVRWLIRDRYDSAGRARTIDRPVLLVIAANDEIIPRRRSGALAEAFPAGRVRTVVVPGAMHNTLDLSPMYLGSVRAFLAE